MMSAVRSILCFDAMRAATRRSKGFSVADIATGDFRETEVRAYLRLCMARGAVEIVPERRTRAGRHVILYRAVDDLPPLLPPTDDEAPQVRKLLMARLVTRKRDADLAAKQSNMWTRTPTPARSPARSSRSTAIPSSSSSFNPRRARGARFFPFRSGPEP